MVPYTSTYFTLLLILLGSTSPISSFGIEIEIEYEWDSGSLSVKKCAITPPKADSTTSLSDVALYETAILAKVIGNQIVLMKTKDSDKISLLNKQRSTIIAINAETELAIKKEKEKAQQLTLATDKAQNLAKNKLSQFLQKQ